MRWPIVAVVLAAPLAAAAAGGPESHYSKTYQSCMVQAGGSTLPMVDCISAETQSWDGALNARYQALMASLPAERAAALKSEERAWIKRRDATCAHAGDEEAGGSLQGVEIDLCVMDETIRRTLALRGEH